MLNLHTPWVGNWQTWLPPSEKAANIVLIAKPLGKKRTNHTSLLDAGKRPCFFLPQLSILQNKIAIRTGVLIFCGWPFSDLNFLDLNSTSRVCHCSKRVSVFSPGLVLTDIYGDLNSDTKVAGTDLTPKQVSAALGHSWILIDTSPAFSSEYLQSFFVLRTQKQIGLVIFLCG